MNTGKMSSRGLIVSALAAYDWRRVENRTDVHAPVWILETKHQDPAIRTYLDRLGLSYANGDYSTRTGRMGENKFFFQVYEQGIEKLKKDPEILQEIENLFPEVDLKKKATNKPGKEELKKKLAAEAVIVNSAVVINEVNVDGKVVETYSALKVDMMTKNSLALAVREFFNLDIDHDFKGINHVSKFFQREKRIAAEVVRLMMPNKKIEQEICALARENAISVPAMTRKNFGFVPSHQLN